MEIANKLSSARVESLFAWSLAGACFLGIFPLNLFLGVGCAFLLYRLRQGHFSEFKLAPWGWGILIYLVARILAVLWSPDLAVSARHLAKDWRLAALAWGATGVLARNRDGAWILFGAMSLNLVYAIATVFGYDLAAWGLPAAPEFFWRGKSLWMTGSLLGLTLTLGGVSMLMLVFGTVPVGERRPRQISTAIAVALLLLSGTRSAWLGAMAAVLPFLVLRPRRYWPMLVAVSVAAGAIMVLPATKARVEFAVHQYNNDAGSVGRRFELWDAAIEMGREHPLGVGPGRFTTEAKTRAPKGGSTAHAHNVPLHIFAESGIIGLIGWLALLAGIAISVWRSAVQRRAPALAILTAMTVAGMFELNFYDGEVATLFFLTAGHCIWWASGMNTDHVDRVQLNA